MKKFIFYCLVATSFLLSSCTKDGHDLDLSGLGGVVVIISFIQANSIVLQLPI